jgi:hypothetical protein
MVLAIDHMGTTVRFIFVLIGIVCFVAAGIGVKFGGERAQLVGLGLAAVFFITFWDLLAEL